MRGSLAVFLGAAFLMSGGAEAADAATPTPFAPAADGTVVVFRHATLIDGTGAPARADMDVLIDGARIQRVLPDSELDASSVGKAKTLDVRGRYLIPGLVDSHVHLATPPNSRQAAAVLRRDVYGGVTAVRDMADDLRVVAELTRASLVGEIAAPDIYYAALMAGPDFFTDKRTIQVSAGAVPGQVPWLQAVTKQTDLPLAVALARGTYASGIKLYADLPADLAASITAEAHRQHILVWAHATLYPAKPSEVVAAGVDSISHACLLVHEGTDAVPPFAKARGAVVALDPFRDGKNPDLARLFATMVQRGTILDATVWTYGAPSLAGPPGSPPRCGEALGGVITAQAYRAGVAISAGTDNFAPYSDPWPDLFHEIDDLVTRAAMPLPAVLQSATLISARATGHDREMGSIEPGKLANLVILARDPLAAVRNLQSVVMTVKRGRIYRRRDFRPLRNGDVAEDD